MVREQVLRATLALSPCPGQRHWAALAGHAWLCSRGAVGRSGERCALLHDHGAGDRWGGTPRGPVSDSASLSQCKAALPTCMWPPGMQIEASAAPSCRSPCRSMNRANSEAKKADRSTSRLTVTAASAEMPQHSVGAKPPTSVAAPAHPSQRPSPRTPPSPAGLRRGPLDAHCPPCEPRPGQCGPRGAPQAQQESGRPRSRGGGRRVPAPACPWALRTPGGALCLLCGAAFLQGMTVNGLVNTAVTSLERRFDLPSTWSGLIASAYDVAACLCLAPVSHLGGRGHRPRWLGGGVLLMGTGALVFALPHFAAGPSAAPGGRAAGECWANRSWACGAGGQGPAGYQPVFVLGQLLQGAGATPLYTLGVTYLDESVQPSRSPVFMAAFYTAAILGPAAGYLVGGALLGVHTDLDRRTELTSESPLWVGAWWLGFLGAAVAAFLVAIPLLGFPRRPPGGPRNSQGRRAGSAVALAPLPRDRVPGTAVPPHPPHPQQLGPRAQHYAATGASEAGQLEAGGPDFRTSVRELPGSSSLSEPSPGHCPAEPGPRQGGGRPVPPRRLALTWPPRLPASSAVWRLLKNPPFLLLCLAGATEATLVSSMSTFGPKFLQSQLSLSASQAATLFGERPGPRGRGLGRPGRQLGPERVVAPHTPSSCICTARAGWQGGEAPASGARGVRPGLSLAGELPSPPAPVPSPCPEAPSPGLPRPLPPTPTPSPALSHGLLTPPAGCVVVPAGGGGTVLGGLLVSKLKLRGPGTLRLCLLGALTSLLATLAFFTHCPNVPLAGVTAGYDGRPLPDGPPELTAACNAACRCPAERYSPVCGADGLTYYSPCHAGCPGAATQGPEGQKVFQDCRCVPRGPASGPHNATAGTCPSACRARPLLLAAVAVLVLTSLLSSVPALTATLRCVCRPQRSLALGVQWIVVRALGSVPGPVAFGWAMDRACLLWQRRCGRKGSCLAYQNVAMSRAVLATGLAYKFTPRCIPLGTRPGPVPTASVPSARRPGTISPPPPALAGDADGTASIPRPVCPSLAEAANAAAAQPGAAAGTSRCTGAPDSGKRLLRQPRPQACWTRGCPVAQTRAVRPPAPPSSGLPWAGLEELANTG
ncbi:Solute carrier organic anion transporter family member 4A1 [Galemys pyrenaicus]|uniref:Solute carrier organic anion transporter family member 4A1 n=1 Tax=Galemys pyrenaicus TaxID=202257 RepID=A0A8J6A717_GALPY|nr:Solute carrier organic anion transporter family member 4A1 [Galemys pyrenaicus]